MATRHPSSHPSRLRAFFRIARFVPLVMLIMMTGGLIALYFQPPGIRIAMRVLGLEPGGGTSHPIACLRLPRVRRRRRRASP